MPFVLNKQFTNIKGLDLRSSDLLREAGAATETKNAMFRQTGALSKRKGYQIKTDPETGGAGLIKYNNIDINTGVITEELITLDDGLHVYTSSTFAMTYTGSSSAYYDMYYSPTDSVFYFDVYNNNTRVLNLDLGSGLGASDTTVDQLVTAINALTDFTSSVSGSPSIPAAFIPLSRNTTISTAGITEQFFTWTQAITPSGYTTPFSTHWAARNDNDFELATSAVANDALYISNGYDDLHKYDGNRVTKVGLAKPSDPSVVEITGTTFALNEVYKYKYLYEYIDAKGNVQQGEISELVSQTLTATKDLRLTVSNLQSSSGYNTDQAVVNGIQASVTTITVDSGHNLQVDDNVYILDGISGLVVSRKVEATTATTIDISGSAIDVGDNEIISNIKLKVYRTKDASTLYYELVELVNDTDNATQDYDDSIDDANLLIELVDPVKPRNLPPKGRYIDVWRNNLIITGDRENVNKVYYSDIDSPEYFPSADNNFLLAAKQGGGNSGLKVLDNILFVFKPESIHTVTGNLDDNAFQVNPFSDEGIGCIAHATIKEINRRVWFLGNKGVYSIGSSDIQLESEPVEPRFKESFNSKQSVAYHWIDKDMYVLLLPTLSMDGSNEDYYDSSSKILVYDKFRKAWLEWNNFNMLGGMVEYNDEIYFCGREVDPISSTAKTYTKKVLDIGSLDDYMDHNISISFVYKSHWEDLGEPSVFKKFNRIRILSLDGSINDFETDDFSINISTEHDYLPSTVSSLTLDMSGGGTGYGNGAWDEFLWGDARLTNLGSKLASKKAKSLRTIFENNNSQENVLISGWEFEVATPYDLAIKE